MSLLSHKLALLRQRQSSPARLRVQVQYLEGYACVQIQHHKDGEVIDHSEIARTIASQGQSHWQKTLGEQFEKAQFWLLAQKLNPTQELWRIPLPLFLRHLQTWQSLDTQISLPSEPKALQHIPGLNPQIQPFDYQLQGIAQIHHWIRQGHAGIMADDMGLGKTLQTLCALACLEITAPVLVLCPASLTGNWIAETHKFFPGFKTLDLSHTKRAKERWRAKNSHLVVYSLGTARMDLDWILTQNWSGVILDEAHLLKNPKSQIYRALRSLQCPWKLALTGTPLANHPKEWHALLDLIQPELWGERSEFTSSLKDPAFLQSARSYLLRRRKEEVLHDLPPTQEIDLEVDMHSEQEDAYLEALQAKETLLEKMAQEGYAKNALSLFALIQRLRKICNWSHDLSQSPKALRLLELLEHQCQQGHKTLIFSQSLNSLDALELQLQAQGIATLRLCGSTPSTQRQALVQQFQNSNQPMVFLLSTHAAGVGLNLTAANTCVFYDHDWNPSWDAQARDRAHRIGQTQRVRIFRFICRGSYEAKILKRARQKLKLGEDLLSHGIQSDWNLEEIRDLLSYWSQSKEI